MAKKRALIPILLVGLLLPSCGGGGKSSSSEPPPPPARDTAPPVLLSTNPANLASGVPLNATISANLSENITAAATALTLAQAGTTVPGVVTHAGTTVSFTPAARLGASLAYTATLSTSVQDLAGNPLASAATWSFITGDCSTLTLTKQVSLGAGVGNGGMKALATDGAAIYLWILQDFSATSGTIVKVEPSTGLILSSVSIPLVPMAPGSPLNGIQFIADLAWHNGALWATGTYIGPNGTFPQGVFRINQVTGLAENPLPVTAGLTGEVTILQGLASNGTHLFVAMDRHYAPPKATEHLVVTVNPATSSAVPLAPALLTTTGQATRLDHGGGSLWVFNNPGFQQINPSTGALVSSYCKNDGGANILYFNAGIWSIKDNILMVYSLP